MLNINGEKIFTQTELMENLVKSIKFNIPDTLHDQHILLRSVEIGDMIGESEHYVRGYLRRALKLQR